MFDANQELQNEVAGLITFAVNLDISPEEIEPDAICQFHLLQQIPEPHDRIHQGPSHGISHRGDEAVESYLHRFNCLSELRPGETSVGKIGSLDAAQGARVKL